MNTTYQQFFSLLRAGLWNTQADATLFNESTNWMALLKLAKKQTLLALVYDGIQTLPSSLQPERKIYLQWSSLVAQIEEENELLNGVLKDSYTLLTENGIAPILMKGQGVAQNYQNPLHRQSGDIDYYVGEKDFDKANRLLRAEATSEHEENHKHTSIVWHDETIENHRIMSNLSAPLSRRFFHKTLRQWYPQGREVRISGFPVQMSPLEFDIAFVLLHSVLHFLNEGIGLRQVCDWTMILHANRKTLDKDKFIRQIKGIGLTKAARVFGAMSVDFLGMPAEDLPFTLTAQDHAKAVWLMKDILAGGNFGKYYENLEKRPKGYWSGKFYTFRRALRRCIQLGDLAPSEARWYPLYLVHSSLSTQIKKRFGK